MCILESSIVCTVKQLFPLLSKLDPKCNTLLVKLLSAPLEQQALAILQLVYYPATIALLPFESRKALAVEIIKVCGVFIVVRFFLFTSILILIVIVHIYLPLFCSHN